MPILTIPSPGPYPPGITGDPYTPDDISKFYDLNWPDHAGLVSTGLGNARIPARLINSRRRGMGQAGCICGDGSDGSGGICADGTIPNCLPITSPTIPYGGLPDLTLPCPAGQSDYGSGCVPTSTTTAFGPPLNTPVTPAQAGLTPAQEAQLIAATGNSAVSLIRTAAGGPYTVAGTNLVYNPATGMLTTAAGANQVAAALVNPFGSLGATLGQYAPLIIAAIAAVVILPSLMGKK